MREVTAYEDSEGRLHLERDDAALADFMALVREAIRKMPRDNGVSDVHLFASLLASDVYKLARVELAAALRFFKENLES